MPKRNRIAAAFLAAIVFLVALIALITLRPAEDHNNGAVKPPPASGGEVEFDHWAEKGTCSICHAPTPAHMAMEFNRCEDCHAYPTWDAPHPEDTDCAKCHKYDPPAAHPAITTSCVTCHPKVGEAWDFVHTGMETNCLECHTVPADHYGDDCARCHEPSVPWAETQFPHTASMNCLQCHARPHPDYRGASCAQCHPGLGVTWLFRHPQFPTCASCHEARRPAGHPGGDCAACHRPPTWKPASHPGADSNCIACHKPPHRADYPVSCATCHPVVGVTWKPAVHVRPMTCTLCHTSPADTANTNHPDANCESCHDIPPKKWADGSHPGGGATCTSCHKPPAAHPTSNCGACHPLPPAAWQDAAHPEQSADCATCHTAPATTTTTDHPDNGCGVCHAIPPAAWNDGVHPAPDSTCLSCHLPPHRTDYPVACAECHPQVAVAWLPALHTTYTDCAACHTSPANTATTDHPDTVCESCHAAPPATWQDGTHPAEPVDCATCHVEPVPHPATDCGSCHDVPPAAWQDAPHPDATAECTQCHVSPPDTSFTNHPDADCASCHPVPPSTWFDASHPAADCRTCHPTL